MKAKFLLIVLLISFASAFAQQKEGAKLMKADESGFIQVDKAPALISELKPVYPNEAKLAGIEGAVYLKLLIDEKGNVVKAKVEQGVKDLLDNSALAAAKKAKFSPAMLNNKPIKVWVVLPIAFKLDVDKKNTLGQNDEPGMNDFIPVQKMPEMTDAVKPAYPEEAEKNGITGKVFVKLLVDKEGNPKKAFVIKSDNEILNQPAIDAAMKSKFTPAMKDKQPIAVWIVLPYRFQLAGKPLEDKFENPVVLKDIGIEEYSSIDGAEISYNLWVYWCDNPKELQNIVANVPEDLKLEKTNENISFGDELKLFKGTSAKEGVTYNIVARKGKSVYKFKAQTLDEIRKQVEEWNNNKSKNVNEPGNDKNPQVFKLPEIINSITPDYPEEAMKNRIEGKVYLKVLVDLDGSPRIVRVIRSENGIFTKPAMDAVMKSKFTPALYNGEKVSVWIVLPYRFALPGKEKGESDIQDSIEDAKKSFDTSIFMWDNPKWRKDTGNLPDMKAEKIEGKVSYGDQSALYKVWPEDNEYNFKYMFIARKGAKIYRTNALNITDIQKYVDDLKEKEKNSTNKNEGAK